MELTLIVTALFIFHGKITLGQELTEEKARDIDRLLKMTCALKIGLQFSDLFVQQLSQALKNARPDIPQKAFDIVESVVGEVIAEEIEKPSGLRRDMRFIYHKYFSHEEVREMIAFNSTSLGQKIIRVMPILIQEGMQAGQKWGQSLVATLQQRLAARLEEEGIQMNNK